MAFPFSHVNPEKIFKNNVQLFNNPNENSKLNDNLSQNHDQCQNKNQNKNENIKYFQCNFKLDKKKLENKNQNLNLNPKQNQLKNENEISKLEIKRFKETIPQQKINSMSEEINNKNNILEYKGQKQPALNMNNMLINDLKENLTTISEESQTPNFHSEHLQEDLNRIMKQINAKDCKPLKDLNDLKNQNGIKGLKDCKNTNVHLNNQKQAKESKNSKNHGGKILSKANMDSKLLDYSHEDNALLGCAILKDNDYPKSKFNNHNYEINEKKESNEFENRNEVTLFPNLKTLISIENLPKDLSEHSLLNAEYIGIIQGEIFNFEMAHFHIIDYSSIQKEVTDRMRRILINWIVEVHRKYKLMSETLFLTVDILDRYLERVPIERDNFQLLGVSSMLIGSKYEEIYPPTINDFADITAHTYNKTQILDMEKKILIALDYDLNSASSLSFFMWFKCYFPISKKGENFCKCLLELALLEFRFRKYKPSMLAFASCIISIEAISNKPYWNDNIGNALKYTEDNIRECKYDLIEIFNNIDNQIYYAVKDKFQTMEYDEVSLKMVKIQNLSFKS